MVCSHCTTKRPIYRPTKMGCIEFIIICVGVGQCERTINNYTVMAVNDTIMRFTISLGSFTLSENERERKVASGQVLGRFYLLFLLRNRKGQRKCSFSLNVSASLKYN